MTVRMLFYVENNQYHIYLMLISHAGLHYDALALAAFEGAPEAQDITMFPVKGSLLEEFMGGASSLVSRYHDMRQFTDTSKFTLRCNVCQLGLVGEKEAVQHAQATGHDKFSEY